MMRIHFTGDDLQRVTVAAGADPLWEVLLSLHTLQERDSSPAFDEWRRRTWAGMTNETRLLLELAPPLNCAPDLVTSAAGDAELGDQVERVLASTRSRLRNDIGQHTRQQRRTPLIRSVASGDADSLGRLGRALTEYYQVAIAPYSQHIQAHVESDRDRRRKALASGGVDRLLATLHPSSVWRLPVLEFPICAEHDLHLDGRGLVLVPSFFCRTQPVTVMDGDLPPVLVYPTSPPPDWLEPPAGQHRQAKDPVAALLGGTRAAVLRAATSGANTTDLGARLNISTAAVSRHTAVLRDAGLVQSIRDGGSVFHYVTPLGLALLNPDVRA